MTVACPATIAYLGLARKAPVRELLERGAAVALGNGLDRAHVPALGTALRDDPHPGVRGHAAWALGRIGSPAARALLAAAYALERDSWVSAEIEAALEPCRPSAAF